ncbi:SusC/RagA family TonB-linked outer membrane protein [Pedobacter sp. PACM 27299]|uniref:SusC/RagA family TonB-linked outer membrane protein n=1 Tax=Pedobacter sp. PACM 27299 TaxID=1727164 RepID=UPI0009EC7333|nr:SusC/RagA family TonB-linked outer membrane protein [Pedobacter sp. PACM 27299]
MNQFYTKGKLLFTVFLMFCSINMYGQSKITGTVAEESGPIPGATVTNKNNGKSTSTDFKGGFTIIGALEDLLEIRSIGYKTKQVKVGSISANNIVLQSDSKSLDDVVVTALGIKKEKKAVGYSVQEVKGSDLVKAREPNGISSLTGKVAGLTITPSANLFGDAGIYLRGQSGVLIVVDGVPISSDSWNLSPDDIETYSVLKGANAAALYGSRGQRGAILITTKKGGSINKGFTVDFNSSTQLQTGYNAIPDYQTAYGAGDNFKYEFKDGKGGGINDNDYFVWGPRFEGQLINQYNSPIDPVTKALVPIPWLARGKDNLKNFLRDGLLSTNNIAISTKSEVGDMRVSLSQMLQRGTVPNTKLGSTNFNFSGGLNAGKKVRFEANINYNKQITPNYPDANYGPNSYVYLMNIWGGADYDVRDLQNYWKPGQENIQQYNREYTIYNNPYFTAYENLHSYAKDDIYGHLSMKYSITDKLNFNLRSNVSTWNRSRTKRIPVSGNFYNDGVNQVGGYQEVYDKFWENNTEASFSYADRFKDFGFKSSVFANLRTVKVSSLSASTNGGLIVPGVYDLANTVLPSVPTNDYGHRQVASTYGLIDLDYKNYLFLNLTGRYDKSSTLPEKHNAYFYPSASLSAVISQMIELPKEISFLKMRGSYANVASDLAKEDAQYDIYKLNSTYTPYSTRWNNNTGVTYSGVLTNPDILAARVKTTEVGLEARFLNNRIGFDAAAFYNIEGPEIVNLTVSPTSGVTSTQKNAFTYVRKGLELTVDGSPVKTTDFLWNVVLNWSTNHRWLNKIDGILERDGLIKVGDRADGYFITDFQRDPNGKMIVGTNGLPALNPYRSLVGYSDNNFVASINNSFKYKNIGLSFQVDGRFGGKIANAVDDSQWNSGTAPASDSPYRLLDWQNRANSSWKGSVMTDGLKIVSGALNTDQDGNVISDTRVFANNDVPVLYQTWARNFNRSNHELMRSRTFVKLREVVLTYSVPASFMQRTKIVSAASLSLVGRNLLYFTGKGTRNMDLDQFISGAGLQTPSVKSFGLNLNVTF